MPMRVSFELSDGDLQYFRRRMREARSSAREHDEPEVLEAAGKLLSGMAEKDVPDFVFDRIRKIELLIQMLEDSEWRLAGSDRSRVLNAMAYFAETEDLIHDQIPGLGFLDDAIMVELVCQDLCHEIEAYEDFSEWRNREKKNRGPDSGSFSREQWTAAVERTRRRLQTRMRRRNQARRDRRARGVGGRSPFALF